MYTYACTDLCCNCVYSRYTSCKTKTIHLLYINMYTCCSRILIVLSLLCNPDWIICAHAGWQYMNTTYCSVQASHIYSCIIEERSARSDDFVLDIANPWTWHNQEYWVALYITDNLCREHEAMWMTYSSSSSCQDFFPPASHPSLCALLRSVHE